MRLSNDMLATTHPGGSVQQDSHIIVHRRKQYVVTGVKPYRTSECKDESQYPAVTSGRESGDADGQDG